MTNKQQTRLTRNTKRALDGFRLLLIASLILWPISVAVMSVGQTSHPDSWGVDIDVYSGFAFDLSNHADAIASSSGVRDPVIKGKAALKLDTSSPIALYVFTAITLLTGVVALYILNQLRAVFTHLLEGSSFAADNVTYLRRIGIIVIAWSAINPLLQYFGGRAILKEYALNVPGIQLSPAFEVNGLAIFIGVTTLVLAGVIQEANRLKADQELTI